MKHGQLHLSGVLLLLCATAFSSQAQFGAGIEIASDVPNDLHGRIEAVDLDGDGDLDLVFKTNAGLVWVQNLDGAGNFGTPDLLAVAVADFAVADVDGDGDQDVVYADGDGQLFWIANLDGLGTFGPPQLVAAIGGPVGRLLCADLDGDGLPEVALALNSGGQAVVQVFLNTGGAFAPAMVTPFGTEGSGLRLLHGDIDLDGHTDLVTLDGDGMVRVMVNEAGDAMSWILVQIAETVPGARLQLKDMDDDGDLDILMTDWGLMQWAENASVPGLVLPFVAHDIAPDGVANHFGHALRLGCGPGVSIVHFQGLAGHLFWSFFDEVIGDFIRPSPDILIAGLSPGLVASADVDGDGRDDIIHRGFGGALSWYPNEFPVVSDPASVSIAPFDPVCEFTWPFTIDNGVPAGGLWSGPGVSMGVFFPVNTGAGTFTLSYQAAFPCPWSVDAEIVVLPTASEGVELVPFPILCGSGGAYPLDAHASPSTGIWSGPGVWDNVFVPPGIGTFTLTYSIEGSCIQVQSDMEVIGAPVVVLVEGDINNGCGTDPLVFEAYPPGGTWSGLAGPGGVVPRSCDDRPAIDQVLYTYAAPNGDCVGSAGFILDLKACAGINLGPDTVLCSNADTLIVTVSAPAMSGITLQGFDLVVSTYNPTSATGYFSPDKPPGIYTLTGIRTTANYCPGYDTLLVTVVAAPEVVTGQYGPLCSDGGPIELMGQPAGGVWSGNGVTGDQFDPTEAGTGTWTVTYTVTENECTGSASTDIEVNGSIPISPGTYGPLCALGDPIVLDQAQPPGGTWSGPGVVGDVFTPPGPGSFVLTYTVMEPCEQQAQTTIEVFGMPTIELVSGDIANSCGTDPLQYAAEPPGGTWSGLAGPDGVVPRSCDDRPAIGQVLYTYAAPNGDCVGSAGDILDLKACVPIDLGPDIVLCSNADTLVVTLLPPFNGGAGLGGDFDLVVYNPNPPGPQVPTGYFSPDKPPGVYTLTGIRTASNQCPGYDTLLVTVVAAPEVDPGAYGPACSIDGPITLEGSPAGGTWSGIGVTGDQFDPATGTQTIVYTVTEGICTSSGSVTIEVEEPTIWYADQDGDGLGDPMVQVLACEQPDGYVTNDLDPCPFLPFLGPGDACDDGDPSTGNDTVDENCICVGEPLDCNGDVGGTAFIDNCGECVGGNTGEVACVADCNGDFGGTAFLDGCGDCVGGNTGEVPCAADCNGDFGGTAFIDNCGDCVGGNTGEVACVADCNGDFGGTAFIDNCGDCVGGTTGLEPCANDCLGVPGGDAEEDECGDCYAGGASHPLWNSTCEDCAGVPNGNSQEDECGVCYAGGASNPLWNFTCADCAGVPNGNSQEDECGVCYAGGASNPLWNSTCADCAGVPNGNSEDDECGECYAGGASHPLWNTTCADCAGEPNGPAQIGTPCDDDDPNTENTYWTDECNCDIGTAHGRLDNLRSGVLIFPNPSPGLFTIRFNDLQLDPVEIAVYNSMGQMVKAPYQIMGSSEGLLNLEGVPSGLYYLRLLHTRGVGTYELVIQR